MSPRYNGPGSSQDTSSDGMHAVFSADIEKLTPYLGLLLVHDLLLSKRGIALPADHGLRRSVERHRNSLTAELTRARLRRKASSLDALRSQVEDEFSTKHGVKHPRWLRINTLKSTLEHELSTTLKDLARARDVAHVTANPAPSLYIDEHIPNLIAVPPTVWITKTRAYKSGAIVLQDKASCFPAYLLDPHVEDGDIIDACAAPGNKTTHLAAIIGSYRPESKDGWQTLYAFEKDEIRFRTLEKMVKLSGVPGSVRMSFKRDFLGIDPESGLFRNVGALLLDPSCSGSGIVGRDHMPPLHLPDSYGANPEMRRKPPPIRKRKRTDEEAEETPLELRLASEQPLSSKEVSMRLEALSSFQLALVLHAFKFPAAHKVTYSTCSVYAEENEEVVLKALHSDIAKERGWRLLSRQRQVRGLREWPVRGSVEASKGDHEVADACIRCYEGDGRGTMGFFVAAFYRDSKPPNFGFNTPSAQDSHGLTTKHMLDMSQSKPLIAVPNGASAPGHKHAHIEMETDLDPSEELHEDVACNSSMSRDSSSSECDWHGFPD